MDDLISRAEAIRIASGYCHLSNIPDELAKLPSVNPKPCEDAISRQAVLDALLLVPIAPLIKCDNVHYERVVYENVIKDLPSVTPAPKMGRWIPVSERLPEDHLDVLVYLSTNRMTIACYNSHRLPFRDKPIGWGVDVQISVHTFCSDDVVAWMPLPEPYTGAKMVEPQESDYKCHTCKHYTSGERDGSCGSYICKHYSNWESEDAE